MFGTDNNGAGCSVGIDNFTEFAFARLGTATLDSASQIEVTPEIGGFSFSQIGGQFMVPDNKTAEYQINYQFNIDPTPNAGGGSLGMDPVFGNVSADQYYCADSFIGTNANGALVCQVPGAGTFSPQDLHVDNTNPPSSLNTGVVVLNPVVLNFATVQLNLSLDGTGLAGGSGFDSVTGDSFISNITTAPEPYAWLLALGGLLAIIVRKRISHVPS